MTTQYIDLLEEFPPDDTPVVVRDASGSTGVACYCPVAGDWYIYSPHSAAGGLLWSDVRGADSEIVEWMPFLP